jgi:hypothetical protein
VKKVKEHSTNNNWQAIPPFASTFSHQVRSTGSDFGHFFKMASQAVPAKAGAPAKDTKAREMNISLAHSSLSLPSFFPHSSLKS